MGSKYNTSKPKPCKESGEPHSARKPLKDAGKAPEPKNTAATPNIQTGK